MIFLFLVVLLTSYTSALPREGTDRHFVRIKRAGPPNYLSHSPPADSIPVLKPRHQRDHDFVDFKHFKPGSNGTFYYSHPYHEDPSKKPLFVELTHKYKYSTVNLNDSSHYRDVQVRDNLLTIFFEQETAFNEARAQWIGQKDLLFLMSPDSGGHRGWFRCSGLDFDHAHLACQVHGHKSDIKSSIDEFQCTWGSPKSCQSGCGNCDCGGGEHRCGGGHGGGGGGHGCGGHGCGGHHPVIPCGGPPAATISGLPTIPCGLRFDGDLDRKIGNFTFSRPTNSPLRDSPDTVKFAPGYGKWPECVPVIVTKRFDLNPIHWVEDGADAVGDLADTAVNAVIAPVKLIVDVGSIVVSALGDGLTAVADWLAGAAKDVAGWVEHAVEWIIDNLALNLDGTVSLPFNVGPSPEESSPFGNAFKMYPKAGSSGSNIEAYCVQCGVHSDLDTIGTLRVSPILGIIGGSLEFTGSLSAGLNIGLDGHGTHDGKIFQEQLGPTIPLSVFAIPDVLVLGPMLKVGIDADAHVNAAGQVLAGLNINWQNLDLYIDLMDPLNTRASGFDNPKVDKKFELDPGKGQLSASASLGIPISLVFGINVLNGLFDLSAGLEDRPNVKFEAKVDQPTCKGIDWTVTLNNDINVVWPGGEDTILPLSIPIDSGCIQGVTERGIDNEYSTARPQLITRGEIDPRHCFDTSPDPQYNYTTLQDTTSKYVLLAGQDGNLWLGNAGQTYDPRLTKFGFSKDIVVGDSGHRVLHYFPDTMTTFGVSRIRLGAIEFSLPQTSNAITLVPIKYNGGTKPIYVATDTLGNTYFLAWCGFADSGAKVFLVKDPRNLDTLRNNHDLRWTVLGSVPGECNLVGLTSDVAGFV